MNVGIDQVKVWFTYVVAAFVVVAGFAFLFVTRSDPSAAKDTLALVAGFIGATLSFLYGQVVQSQTAHQTNVAATNLSSSAPTPGTTTTTTTTATPDPADG